MAEILRVAVCDDRREELAMIQKYIETSRYQVELSLYDSAESLLNDFQTGKYDLILLEIQLSGRNGIELAGILRELDRGAVLVFTCQSEDYTSESYRLGVYKYLLKPIRSEDIEESLELARALRDGNRSESHTFVTYNGVSRVSLDEIFYIEVRRDISTLHTSAGKIAIQQQLENLQKLLQPPRFIRCHRSFIVNLQHVLRMDERGDFVMSNGDRALVRVRGRAKIRDAWLRWRTPNLRN